ncbi:MAG: Bifunctional glutamine synthetase adenylyltransferase/adenylyl-removing enzyme [Acidimicrobiales bacterium]|nr:Bifunctional glutamine synthetase adenylyltransferase/adenylyl-removing enzyme [Acidimicrobiales bacterium]
MAGPEPPQLDHRLADAIERSAEPPRSRAVVLRLIEAAPALGERLVADELFRTAVVQMAAASRSLSDAFVADPTLLAILDDAADLRSERSDESYRASRIEAIATADDPRAALRRWKRRELLRIAVRDLLHLADLAAVGRELSALADGCLEAALHITAPRTPFAVIGMGKLGGNELNYASDVDVLFVHQGDDAEAVRVAKAVLSIMSEPTPAGIVFRTDANLRPEGRSGALSRSPAAFASYYSRWAQPWELQALIKARFVAGEPGVGNAFFDAVRPHLWSGSIDPDTIREIRDLKLRGEALLRERGLDSREIKRGVGGIRDIEFAVQLLQLVHGQSDPAVRATGTLEALRQLARQGYVEADTASRLSIAYGFLRRVEHMLQLHDEQQTYALPTSAAALDRLARLLGYEDTPRATARQQFEDSLSRDRATVRGIHERLFFQPLLDAIAGTGEMSREATADRLAAFGFKDIKRTQAALDELAGGYSRSARLMRQMFPTLLEYLSRSPDPDLGLLQLRLITDSPVRANQVTAALRDTPATTERLCRLLGSSLPVGQWLRHVPDAVNGLVDIDTLRAAKDHDSYLSEARRSLHWRDDTEDARAGALRRFKLREELRIAIRDLLDLADVSTVGTELSSLAEAAVSSALAARQPPMPFSVIAMGRFGGAELSYVSDLDVLFVYDGDGHRVDEAAESLAMGLLDDIGARTVDGRAWEIDARLRPEGGKGRLSRTLDGYVTYWSRWADTWEFQSLLRARYVAGDVDLARRFLAASEPFVYHPEFGASKVDEIRRMKRRIENERLPRSENPAEDLKLGPGTLSDIEFTVQLLQLRHGFEVEAIRTPSTMSALGLLASEGVLTEQDADVLSTAYRFCERTRNYRYLHLGKVTDSLPRSDEDAEHLGRMLGWVEHPGDTLRAEFARLTGAARQVVEGVFYGHTAGSEQ